MHNGYLVIEAIKQIYPEISGGFSYWETKQDGADLDNPIDGLIWENNQFPKPTWSQISALFLDIELTDARKAKIRQVKSKRDIFLNSNITVSTGVYKATQTAKSLFFNAVNGRTATQFPMPWRLADDITWVSLSKDQAYELYDAFEAQETSGYQQESGFIKMINDARTIDEVESIVIEFK